ncbi:MAG: fluoride efflux transporter CrcB [Candidatus Eremiobacteraeota bacterium]|nr:fluoride efflux transporter CrcB [Candidatus Eremiobacteraeota bacterium]
MQVAAAFATVALGGALGSMARYAVSTWFAERFGTTFPWGTLAINVVGSFCIGIVLALAMSRTSFSPYLRTFLATGILGGFTTFSAFSFETYAIASRGAVLVAIAYAGGSGILGFSAAALGVALARAV